MKKNAILAGVFISLLIGIYLFEELRQRKELKDQIDSEQAIEFQQKDLISMRLKDVHIYLDNGKYFVGENKVPADISTLKYIFDELSYMRIQRTIPKSELPSQYLQEFFTEEKLEFSFEFQQGKVHYTLGRKLPHSEAFYVMMKKEKGQLKSKDIVVAHDINPEVYAQATNNAGRSSYKYDKLRQIILLQESYFYNRSVVPTDYTIKNIFIENQRNRAFYVDFSKQETTPPIINGLNYRQDFMQQVRHMLQNLRATQVVEHNISDVENLDEHVSTIYINLKEKWLKLYKRYHGIEGNYLLSNFSTSLYRLENKNVTNFFLNVQDFWNKVVIDDQSRFSKGNVSLSMQFKDKVYDVTIPVNKDFIVDIINHPQIPTGKFLKPFNDKFEDLFAVLLGADSYSQADRVSFLNEQQREKLMNAQGIQLNFGEEEIFLTKINDELLIGNFSKKYILHYYVGRKGSISLNDFDYFYLSDED